MLKVMNFDYKYFLVKYFPFIKHRFAVFRILKSFFSFLRELPGSSINFGPPRGIYVNAELHNSANKIDTIVEVVLQEQKKYIREIPHSNSNLIISRFKNLLHTEIIERKGFYLTKSRYFSGHGGTVVTSDDKVFLPCSPIKNEWDPNKHQSLFRLKLPKFHSFNKVVLVDTKGAHDNYGHWLRDHLSRFYWLTKMKLNLGEYTLISTFGNNRYHNFSYEIMKTKGFNFKSYFSTNKIRHFYADVLVIPPYVNHAWDADNTSYDTKEGAFLQSIFLKDNNSTCNTPNRIYISRRKSRRSSPQEAELVKKLSEFGVTEIFLEDYNICEQATIFHNANLIIGFHGSGFANLYFCKKGTTIVEISSPDFLRTDFWDQASILGLRYFSYCENKYKKNITNFRLAIQVPTIIDINNFIDFCFKGSIIA